MDKFIFCAIVLFSIIHGCCCKNKVTIKYAQTNFDFDTKVFDRKVFNNVPIWTIESSSNQELKYNYEGIAEMNGVLYEDKTKKAILFKKNNCSINCWEGVFGLGTKRNVIRNELILDGLSMLFAQAKHEGIYVSYPVDASVRNKTKIMRQQRTEGILAGNEQKFFTKLLLVIDYNLFKKLKSDVVYTTKYLNIFWSAVDLQYRNLTTPSIEIRITGVIIGKDAKALNYVSKNSPDGYTVNIDEVLTDSRQANSFIKKTNISNYDAVMTMTGLSGYIEVGPQKIGSNGVSWNGTVCLDDYNFSVISDDGSYLGIHNAIHEVAHLFGVDHDGDIGNAIYCYPKDRSHLTVMWPRFEEREIEYWSDCSVKALKIFTSDNEQSWCLKNEVHQQFVPEE